LHIKPAEKKPMVDTPVASKWDLEAAPTKESKEPVKSEYKQEKEKILKLNFDDETNWNYLFLN
jgi:hypothetical protein